MRPASPRARLLGAGSALALLAVLLLARETRAHGALRSSVPAAGSHLDRVPRAIRLTFNESAERAFTRIALTDASGRPVRVGPVTIPNDSPRVAVATIAEALPPGVYTVEWQFGGRDGHPVRGSFKFTVAPGALAGTSGAGAGTPSATDTSAPHHPPTSIPDNPDPAAFDAGSPLFATIRWLTFIGAFLIVGAVAFRYAVIGRMSSAGNADGLALIEPALGRAAVVGLVAAVLLLVTSALRLYAQSVAMHGTAGAFDVDVVGTMIVGTLWGKAWILQTFATFAGIAGFAGARRGRFAGWALVGMAAILISLSLSLSGHASASPRWSSLAIAADTLHVIGAAGWLGSLFFVIVAGVAAARGLPAEQRGASVAVLVNSFSPTALLFAGLAGLTGVVSAWIHLQEPAALWGSDYGRILLLKLAALSLVTGTGAYNWLRVRPALGDDLGTQRLRRSATVEILVAGLVLAITSVLVATAAPT